MIYWVIFGLIGAFIIYFNVKLYYDRREQRLTESRLQKKGDVSETSDELMEETYPFLKPLIQDFNQMGSVTFDIQYHSEEFRIFHEYLRRYHIAYDLDIDKEHQQITVLKRMMGTRELL